MLTIARRAVALAAVLAVVIAAIVALDFPQPAQAQGDSVSSVDGRIVVRPWVDDDGNLTRVEFGFRPGWGEDGEDVRGGGDGPDDLFPPKRFLTQRLIESSAGRWLRSSEILIPSAAGSEEGAHGRIIARAEVDGDGRLTRIGFGFRPAWGEDVRGEQSGADDIFPTNRFLTRRLIDNSAGRWLRSSVIAVPAERPVQATEPTEGEVGAGGGIASTDDGATIIVPPGAAEIGAEVTVRTLDPAEHVDDLPEGATNVAGGWDFEVEGELSAPVTIRLPLPDEHEERPWFLAHYTGGEWYAEPFEIVDGVVVSQFDSLSPAVIILGVAGVKACDFLGGKCSQKIERVFDSVEDIPAEAWNAAKEGARFIVGGIETGYSYVKRGSEWLVEFGSQMLQTLERAFNGLWDWSIQAVPPLHCEDESDNVLATLNPGQVLLESCAEDEGEDEHRLRIKNMRRFWIQACPGPLTSPDLRRAPNADVFGPLSNCDLDGGTLLPAGREAEWISQLESPTEIRATFSDSAALMTMVDWILAIVGASGIEGKAEIVRDILVSLRELPALSQLIDHAKDGRTGDVLSELRNILTSTTSLKHISNVIAKAAPSLGVQFGGDVIAAALAVVELWRVPFKLHDLLSAHYSESGTFAAAGFKRTDLLPPIGDGSLFVLAGTSDLYQAHMVDGSLFKRLILNSVVFDGYGFQLSDVRSVEQAEFDRWITTDLARLGDDAPVWRLFPDSGVRRFLDITAEQFEAAGFDWDAVISINQTEFDEWSEGPPITAAELGLEDERDDTSQVSADQFGAVAITVGDQHACALLDTGAVECWGENGAGHANVPGGPFSAVSAGGVHTCGLRPNGAIVCWGHDGFGETDAPGGAFSAVSLGRQHTCGLRPSGAIVCWGHDGFGETDAPGGAFSAVSAGWYHTCGLRTDGAVKCWGWNGSGQADAPDGSFSAVTAGAYHTCGLRTNSPVECWGNNSYGQTDAPDGSFSTISAGVEHTCGLRTSGAVECWGSNRAGQTDAPGGVFSAVSAGGSHTCGLRTSGAIECWGDNDDGQTDAPGGIFSVVSAGWDYACGLRPSGAIECWGDNDNGQTDAPDGSFSAVSAGGTPVTSHTCGLRLSGAVECWGANNEGQADAPDGSFSAVSAGWYHTCGLRPNGAVVCWGSNGSGQANVPGGSFRQVDAGSYNTCGLRTDGAVKCWGGNSPGPMDALVSTVSVGRGHACGLLDSGAVACWGLNGSGQADAPNGSFSAVSAGAYHTCGLRESGEIECWGYTFDGQAQPPAGKHTAISSGAYHACALSEDGTVDCWMIFNGAADVPAWLREPSTITVSGNRPPESVGTIPTTTITAGYTNDDLRVDPYFRDADGDDLDHRASSSDSSIVSVRVRNGRLTITGRRVGSATITVTASDPDGLTAQSSFRVAVNAPVPEPPQISIICPAYAEAGRSFNCTAHNQGGAATSWDWSASGGAVGGRDETYSVWISSFGPHIVRLTASNAGGNDSDSTTVHLVATPPASQYGRCGSDTIKVYWFDRANFRKHHVNLTGEEATRILGPSWWATIGHLSQPACDSWPTGAPVTAANYR